MSEQAQSTSTLLARRCHFVLGLAEPPCVRGAHGSSHEMAPSFKWRWAFDSSDFNRLVDLTAVLFVATAVYQFDARALHGVYGILQWLPALLYVLLIGQRYSVRGRIGLGSLFLSIRGVSAW